MLVDSPIGELWVTCPKNPDPSYGNTRPSVHDTPKRALKQVATWHPMTFEGFLGCMNFCGVNYKAYLEDLCQPTYMG